MSAVKRESKSRLDREIVVRTAMDLADREGLDSLTIRRLASELGVTPMALYWHFEDKQALLDALSDQLWIDALASIEASGAHDSLDEWAQMRLMIAELVGVFRQHPTLATWAPTRVTECEAGLTITERTLDLLARVGLEPERAAEVAHFLLGASVMLVGNQPGLMIPDEATRDDVMRSKQARLLSLPPDRYPRIVAATTFLVSCNAPERYYDLGVDLIVSGMRAAAQAPVG
jgi:AcrR family transcriptional regulator